MALHTDQEELIDLRKSLGVTQAVMAQAMGMPVRTYQTLESGKSVTKPWHLKAAQYAAMEYVIGQPQATVAKRLPRNIREVATSVAAYLTEAELFGDTRGEKATTRKYKRG